MFLTKDIIEQILIKYNIVPSIDKKSFRYAHALSSSVTYVLIDSRVFGIGENGYWEVLLSLKPKQDALLIDLNEVSRMITNGNDSLLLLSTNHLYVVQIDKTKRTGVLVSLNDTFSYENVISACYHPCGMHTVVAIFERTGEYILRLFDVNFSVEEKLSLRKSELRLYTPSSISSFCFGCYSVSMNPWLAYTIFIQV